MRALASKLARDGQPRMIDIWTSNRTGKEVVNYRRKEQRADGEFEQTTLGNDFYGTFRGEPRNMNAMLNDETAAHRTGVLGFVGMQNGREGRLQFVLNLDGSVDEVLRSRGAEESRHQIDEIQTGEVLDLIDSIKPGQMWWEHGVPHFPDEDQPSA